MSLTRRELCQSLALLPLFTQMGAQPAAAQSQDYVILPPVPIKLGGPNHVLASLTDKSPGWSVIFFATSYNVKGCSDDLIKMQEAAAELSRACGKTQPVNFVVVYPEHRPGQDPDPVNVRTYFNPASSRLQGLSAPYETVTQIGEQFKPRARYEQDGRGVITGHTRYAYLVDPQGQLKAIFKPDNIFYVRDVCRTVAAQLQQNGLSGVSCKPADFQ